MPISNQTQSVLDSYAIDVGGKSDPRYTNLIDIITHSPVLEKALNRAVLEGSVKKIQFDSSLGNTDIGAQYSSDTNTITLGPTSNNHHLVFKFAHEVQHANYSNQKSQEYSDIYQSINDLAANKHARIHDYTPLIQKGLLQNQEDEARAHLEGWNAYVEYQKIKNPGISDQNIFLRNIYRTDFSDTLEINNKTGESKQVVYSDLHLNPDLSAPIDAANIAAMGQRYFNKPYGLDYPTHYAGQYLEAIASAENAHRPSYRGANSGRAAQVRIDMQTLGLDEGRLEANGLHIPGRSLGYVDLSNPSATRSSTLDGTQRPGTHFNPILHSAGPAGAPHAEELAPAGQTALPQQEGKEAHLSFFERIVQAARSGDPAALQPIAQDYMRTQEGQAWLQKGHEQLHEQAAQQALEQQVIQQQQQQQQQQTQRGPVMRM